MAPKVKLQEDAEKAKTKTAAKTGAPAKQAGRSRAVVKTAAEAQTPPVKPASTKAASAKVSPVTKVSPAAKPGRAAAAAAAGASAKSAARSSAKVVPVKAVEKSAADKPAAKPRPVVTRGPDDLPAIALDLPPAELDAATKAYFDKCIEKIGFVPNVLVAYAFDMAKLGAFAAMYNDLMLAPSGLSKLEREMIAVAVSNVNRCYYCLTAHGAAVRQLSGDSVLGEQMVMNYRVARLDKRQRAILDFAVKLTERPHEVEEEDRAALRAAGLSERDIWDVAAVTGFFNMSNRIAAATDMRPNEAYHGQARDPAR